MSRRLTTARRVVELLPALDAAFPTDLLPVVRDFLAAIAGATTVDILMADDELLVLRRLPVDMTGGTIEAMSVDDRFGGARLHHPGHDHCRHRRRRTCLCPHQRAS